MRITSLGHTECLIECPLANADVYRILLDSWLSDYCVADCMERSPRVTIDWALFPRIDLIYISHSHLDHLDPYFLHELYEHQSPTLLIAETLAYLVPTLTAALPVGTRIEILRHMETRVFAQEIELTGIVYSGEVITNEEDVMTLFVSQGDVCMYFEVDTVPPLIASEQALLQSLYTARSYTRRLYIASANELEGNIAILDLMSTEGRVDFEASYEARRRDEIHERTEVILEEDLPLARIWTLPGFEVAYIGQGLQFPSSISRALAGTKVMSLEQICALETETAREYGIICPRRVLGAGESISLSDRPSGSIAGLTFWDRIPVSLAHTEVFVRKNVPLHPGVRDRESLEADVLRALNTKFLPTKLADPLDNLKTLVLAEPDRLYIIAVDYSTGDRYERGEYAWGFTGGEFTRLTTPSGRAPNELYFWNDLADYLSWKVELYTSFVQSFDPTRPSRLWSVLGNTFLGSDLVVKKVAYHFGLAREGVGCERVLEYYSESLGENSPSCKKVISPYFVHS